jgi:uncharacterized delta-60 repeat protein
MKAAFTLLVLAIVGTCCSQTLSLDYNFSCNGKAAIRTGGGVCSAIALQPDGKILIGGRGGETISNSGYCIARFNADGTVDSSFGINGKVITIYGGSIQSIVVCPDGKILAGGFLGNIMLVKYLPNGTIDSSFGNNGFLQPQFAGIRYSYCYSLKLQDDGKIVLCGNVNGMNALVARFLPNGQFDVSFSGKGYSILSSAYIAFDIAIQKDGKILIGGQGMNANNFLLARFLADGNLDSRFGDNGIVLTDITDKSEFITSIALQDDGKILAAGRADYTSQYGYNFKTALVRYNTDGNVDNTFGNNAVASLAFDAASADPKKIMLQPDGKILVAGDYTDVYHFHKPSLARFTSNGIVDNSFGDNGSIVTTQFGDSVNCRSAALQQDGKIVIGGYQIVKLDTSILYYTDSFVVVRYQSNSALPVTYLNFSASKQNANVLLNWQTGTETNNNYFSIERSSTGTYFNEIAQINSNMKHSYSYTDINPSQGINYYRLKQVDKDGKFSYSQIVNVVFDIKNMFVVYPNPAVNVLNIKGMNAAKDYHLIIHDAKGNAIAETSVHNNSAYSWNIESISSGLYYLEIISDNRSSTIKFVKQ